MTRFLRPGLDGALALFLSVLVAHAATFDVEVDSNEYRPVSITIAPGDTVRWTAVVEDHTVTADDGSFDTSASGPVTMPVGATFSFTFPNAGTFRYYCTVHGGPNGNGMAGVVRVVAPGANNAPGKPANTVPAASATGISTAPTLTASAFSDADAGDTHAASQWLLRRVSDATVVLATGADPTNKTTLGLSDLVNATAYEWQVRYRDDRGAWSDYSDATTFTTVAATNETGTGLRGTYGSYFPRTGAVKVLATQVDPVIDFDWKLFKPHARTPANNFHVLWEGTVLPRYSERYRFRVRADGGVRLSVNGAVLLDDWFSGPIALYRSGTVALQAGVPATVRLEYFDLAGAASVKLRWSSPSQPLEVVPKARLFPPP